MNAQPSWQELLTLSDQDYKKWLQAKHGLLITPLLEEGNQYLETIDNWQLTKEILKRLALLAYNTADPLAQAYFWRIRANTLQYYEKFELSLHAAKQAARLYEKNGTSLNVAKARTVEVFVLSVLERFAEAIELAHWIRPHYENGIFPIGEARVTHALARAYAASWQLKPAMTEYQRALQLFQQMNLEHDVAACLQNMGVLAGNMDQLSLERDYYQEAYKQLELNPQPSLKVKACFNLAQNCIRSNDYEVALSYLDEARLMLAKLPQSANSAFANLYEAEVRRRLQQLQLAEDLLRQAITQFDKLSQRLEAAQARLFLASLLTSTLKSEQLTEALQSLQSAEVTADEFNLPLFKALLKLEQAEVLLRLQRHDEVEDSVETLFSVFAEAKLLLRHAQAQVVLADCYWRLQPERAQTLYRQALETADESAPALAARCHRGLGRLALEDGNLEVAEAHYKQAIQILDALRRSLRTHVHQAGLQEDAHVLSEELLMAIQQQAGRSHHLLTWIEHFKAGSLADLLAGQPPDATIDEDLRQLLAERDEVARRLDQHTNAVSSNNDAQMAASGQRSRAIVAHDDFQMQEIVKLRRQLQLLDETLARRHHPTIDWRGGITINADQVHGLLDAESLLISYYTVRDRLFALTLTNQNGDLQVHALPVSLSELDKQWIMAKRFVLRPDGDPRRPQQYLGQIYHNLLAPLTERLTDKSRLIILPHRSLVQIPFAGLYDAQNSRYAIQRWTIQLTPSATVLSHCRKLPIATKDSLLIGYPGELDQPDFLLGVQPEIDRLAQLLPNVRSFYGIDATFENAIAEMPGSRVIHLAGHNYFDGNDPLASGMPLSGGRWLRAADLYLRFGHLRGALVVLSGCDTARGQTSGGDVLGLTSAFLYAGATAVVAGLWPVDDEATCALMQNFYSQLSSKQDAATALRNAQIALLENEQFASPYFWSPFSISGDSRIL